MKIHILYRRASQELALQPGERTLLAKFLRELAINTIKSHKAWQLKTDFLTLWFISSGSFAIPAAMTNWFILQLPFSLTNDEKQILYL